MKTAKFGGTSLANSAQVQKVVEIIRADAQRRCIVVSAPGKRYKGDTKVTDLLIALAENPENRELQEEIASRYQEISDKFGLKIKFADQVKSATEVFCRISPKCRQDYLVSRGEYWMAVVIAIILDYEFIDSGHFIIISAQGQLDIAKTLESAQNINLKSKAEGTGIVVPGFYGCMPDTGVKTFPRGGSDISGAIVALCTDASVYENWTDVSGVFVADPRIVKNARVISELTYQELRELAYMGADVLHDEAIFPVKVNDIPINVRNTNSPKDPGTMIVPYIKQDNRPHGSIIGVAGKNGFTVIRIEKTMMDAEIGFLSRICKIMEDSGLNIEHIPSGIDTLSIIIESNNFAKVQSHVLEEIRDKCQPDAVHIEENIALICCVGSPMARNPGVAAKIFTAIAKAGINIRMISQGSSEISIIIGVESKDYRETISAIHDIQ